MTTNDSMTNNDKTTTGTTRRTVLLALAGGVASTTLPFARDTQAQTAWPTKPVKLIVPYPPGGQTDIVSRYLAEKLSPVLGQNVIVENRAGAQGIVGLESLKNSPADGYTFAYVNVSNISLNPYLYEKLPYDPLKDFAAVTQLGLSSLGMVVAPSLGVKTLKDFIAYAKANAGKVSFGSFGIGSSSHIYGEMLKNAAGIDMTHVAYKGAAPAIADVMAGHATMGIHDFATIGPQIQAGKLVPLAVTGPRRWPTFPDMPTFAELGFPLDLSGWNGIMTVAGSPKVAIDRMSSEINKIIQSKDGNEQILKYGLLVTGTTPDAFSDIVRREGARWGEVIRKSGVKL